jgi:hypothetical protein
LLAEQNITINLIGATGDSTGALSRSANRHGGRVNDLRGKTSLDQLIGKLAVSSVAIGPDTGALHLAASLGCRCIGLYHRTAVPQYTAPYVEGSLVAEVAEFSPELARDVVAISGGHSEYLKTEEDSCSGEHRWWHTTLDQHGLVLEPVGQLDPQRDIRRKLRATYFDRHDFSAPSVKLDERSHQASLSVIIPECGSTHYTDALIDSLATVQLPFPCELILISSGAEARSVVSAKDLNVSVITSAEPLSYASACNHGAGAARHPWLLFLNNDTELSPNQLAELFAHRSYDKLVSPVIHYADGTRQNAGVTFVSGEPREI